VSTNLLIGDIGMSRPFIYDASLGTGNTLVCNKTLPTTYPLQNLFGGNKTDSFRLDSVDSGDLRITFRTPGATCNYLYIGGAKQLKYSGVTSLALKAHSSNTYGSATSIHTNSSFDTTTLYGPHGEDYIATFDTTSSYTYWFANYNSSASSYYTHSKLFFGNAFDPGVDPNQPMQVRRERRGQYNRYAKYTFTIEWQKMTYAKAIEMKDRFIVSKRYNPIILFTKTYHETLLGCRVVYGRILDITLPQSVTDYCDVSMTFEEVP
jgi:hypothetical protein